MRREVGAVAGAEQFRDELPSSYCLTTEQLLELVWKVAGASMAAAGVAREDMPAIGVLVAPTINEIVRGYGIAIPEGYRRSTSDT